MKKLFILFFGITTVLSAQELDFNTSKGALIEGYDVVSYFDSKPVKGKKSLSTKHNNVLYYFSSEKNLNTFQQDPNKYIPQYGGYCAYAVAKKKIKMEVDPEVYEIRDGKLYLFYGSWFSDKLKDWQNGDTKQLQAQADKNWKVLKYIVK